MIENVQNKKLELQGENWQRHSPLRLEFKGLIVSSHENSLLHVNIENEQRNHICFKETDLHGQWHQNTSITRNEARPTHGCHVELGDDSEIFLSLPSLLGTPQFLCCAIILTLITACQTAACLCRLSLQHEGRFC